MGVGVWGLQGELNKLLELEGPVDLPRVQVVLDRPVGVVAIFHYKFIADQKLTIPRAGISSESRSHSDQYF